MTTTTTYPNGQALVSTALTPTTLNTAIQALTCGMIGSAVNYALVKAEWAQEGQPFTRDPNTDGVYVNCTPAPVEYALPRDKGYTSSGGPVTEVHLYTKGWRVAWVAYGPTAEDYMRMVRSAMFQDYFIDQLSALNLYPVPDPPEVVYLKEEFNAQWWPRADFSITMYEAVTETIQSGKATSLEIKVYDSNGQVADTTITTA